jgi:hypothetical protein
MADFLFQLFVEGLCYFTGKYLLPVVSLGYLVVEEHPGPWWNPFSKLPNGRVAVSHDGAAIFGLFFWVVVVIAAVVFWKRS